MSRETGHVKWFSNEKGFGFIEREGREDVFVHHSEIEMDGYRTLEPGERVEFDLLASDKGPKAQRVSRLEASANGTAAAAGGTGDEVATPVNGTGEVRGGEPPRPGSNDAPTLAEQLREKLGKRLFGS